MALDGLVIHALVDELQQLIGGRIHRIHQPTEHDIVMQIRAKGTNCRLLLSAHPTYPRVHLTGQQFENPQEAPMFCMLMRKHCEGGSIESIRQVKMERIIRIDIRQRNEVGDLSLKTVVVELMGRHSNIILLDPHTNHIFDGIRHVTPAISSYRVVLPGSPYVAPPEQHKAHPFHTERSAFISLFTAEPEGEEPLHPEQRLVAHFSGISPLVAREIVHLGGISQHAEEKAAKGSSLTVKEAEQLWEAFFAVMKNIREGKYVPNITLHPDNHKAYFSVIPLTHLKGTSKTFPGISPCLEAYFSEKAEKDLVKQKVSDLVRLLQNEKNKNIHKIEKLKQTMEEAKEAEKYRLMGELLTANLHRIQKGDEMAVVTNYYDEEQKPMAIPLNPQWTPAENAQHYFKKYSKSKNSLAAAQEQIALAEEEMAYIDNLLAQLETASLSDVEEIRDELREQGYLRDRKANAGRKKKKEHPQLLCYTSSEGIPIYVGKNNMQNEYLTHRLADPKDTWLHTKDIPGSHVVIRASRYGQATLEEAAMLAAYYSRARESSQVPVDFTLIRHVRKPSGGKPGFVIYDHQKTLFVTPDKERIEKLQKINV